MSPIVWVIVSYGNPLQAMRLARKLESIDDEVQIIIGCNAVGDAQVLRQHSPGQGSRILVVDSDHNPGYLGFLEGISTKIPDDAIVVLSNADLHVHDEFMTRMRESVEEYPHAAMLAPSIIGRSNRDQNPHLVQRPSRKKLRILQAVHRFPQVTDLILAIRGKGHSSRSGIPAKPGARIYAGHGSCMIFTPSYRQLGGSFAYPMFLFGEEIWVGVEVERIRAEVRYVPDCKLDHEEHAVTGSSRRGPLAQAQYESLKYWAQNIGDAFLERDDNATNG